ncbi:MAG: NHL repeat-containing protein [bacterium]
MFSFTANVYWILWKEAPLLKPRPKKYVPQRVASKPLPSGFVQKMVITGFSEPYGITEAPEGMIFVSDFLRDKNMGVIRLTRVKEAEEAETTPKPELFATAVSLHFPSDIEYFEGFLYVVEHSGNPGVWKISLADGTGEFYSSFPGTGEFLEPRAISLNHQTGEIYVADRGKGKIWHFNREWKALGLWSPPSSLYSFFSPNGLYISSSPSPALYITDKKSRKVLIYYPETRKLFSFGTMGLEKGGEFYTPTGICVDKQGRIFVADFSRNLVQAFDINGKFLFAIGPEQLGDPDFAEPRDVLVDSSGFLWITGGKFPGGKVWRVTLPPQ